MIAADQYIKLLEKRKPTVGFSINICEVPDSFQCLYCRTYVANAEEIVEEDRIRVRPLKFKFCPNCGRKIIG